MASACAGMFDLVNDTWAGADPDLVLVAAREQAASDIRFGVVASGPATSRPLTLIGLADIIGLYPTLAEARDALGA